MYRQNEKTNSEKPGEDCGEIETRLRRQMIVGPKRLLMAGSLSLPAASAHLKSVPRVVTPFHLLLAATSVGVAWFSARWWNERKPGRATS
jgi:hypothetical protein